MQVRGENSNATEFEIVASKDHWSELDIPRSDEEDEITETDLEVFQSLQIYLEFDF